MENQIKDPKAPKRMKTELGDVEVPAEFECCFCSTDVSLSKENFFIPFSFYLWLSLMKPFLPNFKTFY